jgi:outer membrane protein OmpA-like peptidoglycan-associated protein
MKALVKILIVCLPISMAVNSLHAQSSCTQARDLYKEALAAQNNSGKIRIYQKVIELCPNYAEAHNNLADAYEKAGYIDKAEKEYKEALRIKPDLASAYLSLGDLNYQKEDYAGAVQFYEKGLALHPQDELAIRNLQTAKEKLQLTGAPEKKSDQVIAAKEIMDKLDQVKTMGVGGVGQAQSRIAFKNILFDFNSERLKKESFPQLDEIGKALSTLVKQKMRFIIEGHTDSIGGDDFNQILSEKRADTVKEYLVKHYRISQDSLRVMGFGKTRPVDTNSTEEGRQNNRRVEVVRDNEKGSPSNP